MSNDVPSDGFCGVSEELVRFALDLVGDVDTEVVFVCEDCELVHVFVEFLLSSRECSSPDVFCSEVCCEAVYDDEFDVVSVCDDVFDFFAEEHLVVAVVCSGDFDVVEHLVWVCSDAFCELDDAFWSECVLGVDEYNGAVFVVLLCGYSESECYLCFSATVLSEAFCYAPGFESSVHHVVDVAASDAYLFDFLSPFEYLCSALEPHFELVACCLDYFSCDGFAGACCVA